MNMVYLVYLQLSLKYLPWSRIGQTVLEACGNAFWCPSIDLTAVLSYPKDKIFIFIDNGRKKRVNHYYLISK